MPGPGAPGTPIMSSPQGCYDLILFFFVLQQFDVYYGQGQIRLPGCLLPGRWAGRLNVAVGQSAEILGSDWLRLS